MPGKICNPVFLSLSVVITLALIPVLTLVGYPMLPQRLRHRQIQVSPRDYEGPGECFSPRRVRMRARCAKCVHFVTEAVLPSGSDSGDKLPRALRFSAGAIRGSHKCFTLHVYTSALKNSTTWNALVAAGGDSVFVAELPRDLPRSADSGRPDRRKRARHKLDLLGHYQKVHRRRGVWVDLHSIIVADLSCAYARAPHFVVSRTKTGRRINGPGGVIVKIHPRRAVYGDLFMADAALILAVRDLEKGGMPPSSHDLQDYFSFLLNRCDGSIIDLRALIRADGFMRGGRMCFGFDFAQGENPTPGTAELKMVGEKLHCGVRANGTISYYPAGALSFDDVKYWDMLDRPEKYFDTPQLMKWAKASGIRAR